MDLQGRLSNPPYHFERASLAVPRMLARRHDDQGDPVVLQLQRRLKPTEVDELVAMYEAGSAVPAVAESFGINRETVLIHLERRGVRRRRAVRKMTDADVSDAAERYRAGHEVVSIANDFRVNPTTLRRELASAGEVIRRPGRPARKPTYLSRSH